MLYIYPCPCYGSLRHRCAQTVGRGLVWSHECSPKSTNSDAWRGALTQMMIVER